MIFREKEFRKFCNSLRCPLCGAQLDGNIHLKGAQLYCCIDNSEYTVYWLSQKDKPEWESFTYYFNDYIYNITCQQKISVVWRVSTDVHPDFRNRYREEIMRIQSRISFFTKKISEEDLIKKIKVYNVFS